MKIAFSTLGCPDWSWNETVATAKDLGYQGIEIRGIERQMHLPKAQRLMGEQLRETTEHLKVIGVEVPCLASSVYLHEDHFEAALQAGEEYIQLAALMGVPYVRVLGDSNSAPGHKPFFRAQVKEGLEILGKMARSKGVTVLIESNGHLADSRLLADLLQDVGEQSLGALWDVHHPFRYFREDPKLTVARLGKAIKYVHMKDSKLVDDDVKYVMLGKGDIPVRDALEALLELNYNGWISLEWVKKWNPDIEEPGIVFSHFMATIRRYLQELQGE